MKYLLVPLVFFLSISLQAQKETRQTIAADYLDGIILNTNEIFRITISTAPVKTVTLISKTDGEYYNNISLDAEIQQHTLVIDSRFREILQSGFDKLSAHKVFSMEIELVIPKHMDVEIRSNIASVFMRGQYGTVIIELKTGSGFLNEFTGDAVINTYDGNIQVETNNATVEATSRHGKIEIADEVIGDNHLKLTSINGNIKVRQTK